MSWFKPKPEAPAKAPPDPVETLVDDVVATLTEETQKLKKQSLQLEIVLRREGKETGRSHMEIDFNIGPD